MMTIKMDPQLARELERSMDTGARTRLPFAAPYLWVVNGDPKMKPLGGALYYGGWITRAEEMLAVCEEKGVAVPPGFARQPIPLRNGEEFEGFATRYVLVAPIGARSAWLQGSNNLHVSRYQEGARRHVQALCLLGSKHGENGSATVIPWGPVVLTAKGYQATYLVKAFREWEKKTKPLRQKVAPGVPAACFYMAVGTFGDKPEVMNVGRAESSTITPIRLYLPSALTEKTMEQLFVTEALAQLMVELRKEAEPWLNAWEPAEGEMDEAPAPPEEEEASL